MIYLLFFIVLFILPQKVYAYLDPGTGSYLIQIIIATFLGGLYLFKEQTLRIVQFVKNLLSRLFSKKNKTNEN